MIPGKNIAYGKLRGEPGETKAPGRTLSMTYSPLGRRFELFPGLRSAADISPADSRHTPIAFVSEGSPRGRRFSVNMMVRHV